MIAAVTAHHTPCSQVAADDCPNRDISSFISSERKTISVFPFRYAGVLGETKPSYPWGHSLIKYCITPSTENYVHCKNSFVQYLYCSQPNFENDMNSALNWYLRYPLSKSKFLGGEIYFVF